MVGSTLRVHLQLILVEGQGNIIRGDDFMKMMMRRVMKKCEALLELGHNTKQQQRQQ
jgi:hypothetical protein